MASNNLMYVVVYRQIHPSQGVRAYVCRNVFSEVEALTAFRNNWFREDQAEVVVICRVAGQNG